MQKEIELVRDMKVDRLKIGRVHASAHTSTQFNNMTGEIKIA